MNAWQSASHPSDFNPVIGAVAAEVDGLALKVVDGANGANGLAVGARSGEVLEMPGRKD